MSETLFQRAPVVAMLVIALFFVVFLLNVASLWLFIPIPAAIVGFLLQVKASRTLVYVGLTSLVATLMSIFYYQPGYKLSEANLIGTIAGIPSGSITLLIITLLIGFLLGLLAGLAGTYMGDMIFKSEIN